MRSALLIAALLAAAAAVALAHEDDRLCLTPEVSDEDSDRIEEIMDRFRNRVCPLLEPGTLNMCGGPTKKRAPTVIPVVWNIFYDPATEEGNISDSTIALQMDILNNDYAGRDGVGHNMNWRFETRAINRIGNERYYSNMIALEQFFKEELANDTAHVLHLYTGVMNGGVLGMCYFAFMYPPASHMHGCLINHQSIVNGGASPYDDGQTATHEIGHHLGLYHVWQNKCGPRSDRVDDTPPQYTNSRGCPDPIPESCTPGLFDNIHNHMDYSDDACRYLFTPGQSDRTDQVIATFHPGYLEEDVRAAILKVAPDAWAEAEQFQAKLGYKMGFPNPLLA